MSSYRLLTLEKAAALVQMDSKELRSLALTAEVPCVMQGSRYMFDADELERWYSHRLLNQGQDAEPEALPAALLEELQEGVAISELCQQISMCPDLAGKSRPAVLKALVELAAETGFLYDPRDLYDTLREREEESSTAMQGGVAMPHPKTRDDFLYEKSFVCIGKTLQPVFFGKSSDGEGSDLFFLICCLDSQLHLQTLSRISLLCRYTKLTDDLREAETKAEMFAALQNAENALLNRSRR